MSSVAKPAPPVAEPVSVQSSQVPWTALVWFAALVVLSYFPVIVRLVDQWSNDEDMGHGFFVPVIAAYIAWQKRDELRAAQLRPNYLGLAVVAFGALQLYIGTLGAELFLARTALVECIVGSVLLLGGWQAIRILAFPLVVLVFMVPLPAVIYNQITLPLQLFASKVAAFALELMGYPVLRDGNVIELPSQKLSVVEACSGIRSLLSLTFLALVYGWFFEKRAWVRVVLFASTIPIAILANAGRVTLTGMLSEVNPELAHGFAHSASGWVIFMIALAMLIITHFIIQRIWRPTHANS